MSEKREEAKEAFLKEILEGKVSLFLGRGKACYKMDRGSFTTHDFLYERHHLKFDKKEGNTYLFKKGHIEATLEIELNEDGFKLHFKADPKINRFTLCYPSSPDEHIYGAGEQFTHLDLKGKNVPIWVSEHQQVRKIAKKFLREKLFGVNLIIGRLIGSIRPIIPPGVFSRARITSFTSTKIAMVISSFSEERPGSASVKSPLRSVSFSAMIPWISRNGSLNS
jgi:hypothetical protein